MYRFLDESGRIAYIGMSKNLSSRVRQHFNNASNPARAQELRRKVHKITWEETGSELMALILEDVLIRRHHPPTERRAKGRRKGLVSRTVHLPCRHCKAVLGQRPKTNSGAALSLQK